MLPKKTKKILLLALAFLLPGISPENYFERGVSAGELESAKKYLKADFIRNNESKEKRTANLAYFESLGLGSDYFADFLIRLGPIGTDELNRTIKEVLNPSAMFWVRIGPEVQTNQEAK